jgi:hypothetical protein
MMELSERHSIEWECQKLCNAFGYYLDQCDFDALGNLFLPEGVWNRHGHNLSGPQDIRDQLLKDGPKKSGPGFRTGMHFVTNFVPHQVEAGEVHSTCYALVFSSRDASEGVKRFDPMSNIQTIVYTDQFKKSPQGWRFASRSGQYMLRSPNWPGTHAAASGTQPPAH